MESEATKLGRVSMSGWNAKRLHCVEDNAVHCREQRRDYEDVETMLHEHYAIRIN